jgi:sirohydrochlorin ferrochelatase
MWNMKCKLVPVITGATRIVTRGLEKNLEATQEKHSRDSPPQTAIFGTSHVIQKVLEYETGRLSGGDGR